MTLALRALFLTGAAALLPLAAQAQAAPEPTCASLLAEAREDVGVGFEAGRAELTMEIRRGKAAPRVRKMIALAAEEGGLRRSLIRFTAPAEVAGTALLMREAASGEDEQLLYLPALKKVRRISGGKREGSFMGSDFSFEDLSAKVEGSERCERLPDAELQGQQTWVVQARPADPSTGPYGRVKVWIHPKTRVAVQMELYGKDGETLVKKMRVQRMKKVEGRWVPTDIVMETVARKSQTRLIIDGIQSELRFPPETFSERALGQ